MSRKWHTQQCAENSTETKTVLVLPTPHRRSKNNRMVIVGQSFPGLFGHKQVRSVTFALKLNKLNSPTGQFSSEQRAHTFTTYLFIMRHKQRRAWWVSKPIVGETTIRLSRIFIKRLYSRNGWWCRLDFNCFVTFPSFALLPVAEFTQRDLYNNNRYKVNVFTNFLDVEVFQDGA